MKHLFLLIITVGIFASCTKNDTQTTETAVEQTEAALVQKPQQMQSAAGEVITVTYFSEGDQVAVKLQKERQAEQILHAKTVNASGNPIFSNENFMWEITKDGQAGQMSDKNGNPVEYQRVEEQNQNK